MKAILVTMTPYDPVTAARVTLRITNVNDPKVTLVSGGPGEFIPTLCGGPVISRSLFDGQFTGMGAQSDSSLTVRLDDGTLDTWMGYVWDGADCTVLIGDIGQAYASYVQVWKGRTGGIARNDGSRVMATIPLGAPANLNRPLLYLAFAGTDVGTGGDTGEGRAELLGVLKPWLSGNANFVPPVLIDPARQIYCYHGYGPTGGATNCYEGGVAKGAPTYTWASYAAMIAQVMASNEWGHCPSIGMIRLGGLPSFPITIDAGGDKPSGAVLTTCADILKRILEGPGGMTAPAIPASTVTVLNALRPQAIDIYQTSQTTVQQLLTDVMLGANGYWLENETGQILLGLLTPQLQGDDSVTDQGLTNLLSSTDLSTWTNNNGATVATLRSFQTIQDSSATTSANRNIATTVTNGAAYTAFVSIDKDSVGKATRFPIINLWDSVASVYAAVDTSTGELFISGTATGEVKDAGDSWLVRLTKTAQATTLNLTLYPAFSSGALSSANAVATQGTVGFKKLKLVAGTVSLATERTIDLDGKASPAVKDGSEQATGMPNYRVRVGGDRTWLVHNPNDIPASIAFAQSTADAASYTYPASATAPTVPAPTEGDLWPDNSTGVTIVRRYTSGVWITVTEIGANVRLVAIGSMASTDVAGNSFKRTAAGTDYNYACYSSQVLANSAYVRVGTPASGISSIALDDDNSTTALASQKWLFEVTVSTGAWNLYKDGASVASGTAGAVSLDTNQELRYIGNTVEAWLGGTRLTTQAATSFQTYYAKWYARQAGSYRQCASGYAALGVDPFADVTAYNTALGDGNRVRFSLFERATQGWIGAEYTTAAPTLLTGVFQGKPFLKGIFNFTANGQTIGIGTDTTGAPTGAYCIPVTGNQRYYVGSGLELVHTYGATATWAFYIGWMDSTGAEISRNTIASGSGTVIYNTKYGNFFTAPSNAVAAFLRYDAFNNTGGAQSGVYMDLIEPMVVAAGANQTVAPAFTPGPSSEAGGDTTKIIAEPKESLSFAYDNSTGNPIDLSGGNSIDILFRLTDSITGATITSGVTWTLNILSGTLNTVTNSGNPYALGVSSGVGTMTVSSLGSDEVSIQIIATYNSAQYIWQGKLKKTFTSAPAGGGILFSQNVFPTNPFSLTTSFQDITGWLGPNVVSKINVNLSFKPYGTTAGSWTVELRVMKNVGGTPTQVGTTQSCSTDKIVGEPPDASALIYNLTGLSSNFQYRLEARVTASGPRSHTIGGSWNGQT